MRKIGGDSQPSKIKNSVEIHIDIEVIILFAKESKSKLLNLSIFEEMTKP